MKSLMSHLQEVVESKDYAKKENLDSYLKVKKIYEKMIENVDKVNLVSVKNIISDKVSSKSDKLGNEKKHDEKSYRRLNRYTH